MILTGILLLVYIFILPARLFEEPTSTVLLSTEGKLLGARIAADGQWRFSPSDSVPDKFEKCILFFEDEYFYYHPGINPISVFRAMKDNINKGRIVSGASTLTMQVIRLSRKNRDRTVLEKLYEMILATRLELRSSKEEILSLYASHAPFGGNVVGLEAASWRYYGRDPFSLSWAESAALAVLPNAPSLIFPGRNEGSLKEKRDHLLLKLKDKGVIDQMTYELSTGEPLPGKPMPLPDLAPHLVSRSSGSHSGQRTRSTLRYDLQKQAMDILNNHVARLKHNEIHNAAAVIMEINSGKVLAYVGNASDPDKMYNNDVDLITAPRSSGSILKPFLYAASLAGGEITPSMLLPDIPTHTGGYSPRNFDNTFSGAVPANDALSVSLNIPAVIMLKNYGIEKFHYLLKKSGFTTFTNPPGHYGLSLILGGGEVTLWDLCGSYSSLARMLNNFSDNDSRYNPEDLHPPILFEEVGTKRKEKDLKDHFILPSGAVYLTFEALTEVRRPDHYSGWKEFSSSRKLAWKTGTSFGFRDAWAVGLTPEYLIAVWAGNADGEGRPGLTGVTAAAPLMFALFEKLPQTTWFTAPWDELRQVAICKESGYRAGRFCNRTDSQWVNLNALKTPPCPYHKLVHLDESLSYRVNMQCGPGGEVKHLSWFSLPPVMEYYYKKTDPGYKVLPPFFPGCEESPEEVIDLIYPGRNSRVFIPRTLDGSKGKVVFEAAHSNPELQIFWHVDEKFLGTTKEIHQMALNPSRGKHLLVLVDEKGNRLERKFEVVSPN